MLRMLTKTLILTLCKSTMLTMLRLLVMSKITNVENVDKDVQSHLVQLYRQQRVGRAVLPRQHRVAQRVQTINLVPGDPDVDHVPGDLDGDRLH